MALYSFVFIPLHVDISPLLLRVTVVLCYDVPCFQYFFPSFLECRITVMFVHAYESIFNYFLACQFEDIQWVSGFTGKDIFSLVWMVADVMCRFTDYDK